MATSLRDIPGAQRPKQRKPNRGRRWRPRARALDLSPGGIKMPGARRRRGGFSRPQRQLDLFLLLLVVGAVLVVGWLAHAFWTATRVDVAAKGLTDGQSFTPDHAAELAVDLRLASSDDVFRSKLTIDGVDVSEDLRPEDATSTTIRVEPQQLVDGELVEGALDEGDHEIKLAVGRLFLADSVFTWHYGVDSKAPTLDVPPALDPVPIAEPVTVTGTVEKGAALTYDGEPLELKKGRFSVDFDHPPTGALHFVATDPAGNVTKKQVVVPVQYPAVTHAIHVSAAAWHDKRLHDGVVALIDQGLIDTVELDLKDEAGVVGYDSDLATAKQIGAVSAEYDLREAVQYFESRHVRVIGRIVAFRDPIYANAAWAAGRKDEVLQNTTGGMLSTYGGFTNYANANVRKYNLDLALEAESMGVKDILWDYIRRPEGNPNDMVVPGLKGKSSDEVVSFLASTQEPLRRRGAYQGASVFGIAAAAGDSIAQDVPEMAKNVDYLAPMLYPSHWGDGMYRVQSPIHEPYNIVHKSLADFQRVTKGTGVRFIPWLQDFSLYGVPYGEHEVREQIRAAQELGASGYLLWDPLVTYTTPALDKIEP
jgi:hypothetical protein